MPSRLLFITTFGLGRLRPAPGTWGSLPPVALAAAMIGAGYSPVSHPIAYNAALAAVFLIFSAVCITLGAAAEARWGKDPSNVVADETAGQCLPLMLLPGTVLTSGSKTFLTLGAAFVLFRILDIVKPWPARQIQRQPAGWGILLDDVFAGLYALGLIQLLTRLVL